MILVFIGTCSVTSVMGIAKIYQHWGYMYKSVAQKLGYRAVYETQAPGVERTDVPDATAKHRKRRVHTLMRRHCLHLFVC